MNMKHVNNESTTFPYRLADSSGNSDSFYRRVGEVTDILLDSIPSPIESLISNHHTFIMKHTCERSRSRMEYLVEILMLGIFWKSYTNRALTANRARLHILRTLYSIRQKLRFTKPLIDSIRGFMLSSLALEISNTTAAPLSLTSFHRLILFLEAPGDFNEEALRLRLWHDEFITHNKKDFSEIMDTILTYTDCFRELAINHISTYTENVEPYINNNRNRLTTREDRLFVSRKPDEYYLNMICAEILNRAFREEFDKTPHKTVLLPTCMRTRQNECQSVLINGERRCTSCTIECTISHITQQLAKHSVQTCLIPHSSSFSRFLKKWENSTQTGLVGVACVLNLIKGGYEMRKLNIPSQCVFLDFSGCRCHWLPSPVPTELNRNRLEQILGICRK